MERGWLLLTGGLAVTSLAAVYGGLSLPGAILRTEDRELAAAGARLGGLLQYPNTFGAVMAAAMLERLTALARLPGAAFTRAAGWRGYWTGVLAPVFALCLLLSESRGALAAAAAGWAAGCLLLRGRERLRYALQSGVAAGAGALLAAQLAAAQLAPPALPGLLSLAAVLAAAIALSGLAARAATPERARGQRAGHRRAVPRHRRHRRHAAAALLGAAALAAGAVLAAAGGLPWRLTRAATLFARGELYADALRMLREAPWFGLGGDVWRTMFRSIQSRPYVGSEVHSGYLDFALDLGIVGLAVMLCWLGVIAAALYRSNRRLLPALCVLLLHSAIDFDMSYGFFWLLILWLEAWRANSSSERPSCDPKLFRSNRPGLVLVPSLVRSHAAQARLRAVMMAFLALVLLAGGISGLRQAESLRMQRLAASASEAARPAEAVRLLERAVALAPARAQARLALAAVLPPAEAAEVLRRGMAYERGHPGLELALGLSLAKQGDPAALTHLRRAAELDRYSRAVQTAALRGISLLVDRLDADGRTEQSRLAAAEGIKAYRSYVLLAERAREGRDDRDFRLTREAVSLAILLEARGGVPSSYFPEPAESLSDRF
ncbi:O-antigen ligase family protein [Paenibacillus vini]|uniref:O-antigen ligase-related domain-containing protein n=1 Tax=Paenibacillus vini TaxID=1476024 RepID=A0ABQ4MF41_9BACL|nr:O-antigen ligase family protein [Paenibacillus vini]GIP54617.1 hypothetical protein J42TS3_36520 [Paenibacillus vini]